MIFHEGSGLSGPSNVPPESAARAFVRAYPELFYLSAREVDALRLVSELPVGSGTLVRFNQTAGGLDVVHGTLRILLDSEAAVVQAGAGNIVPGLTQGATAKLTYSESLEAALRLLGGEPPFAIEAPAGARGRPATFATCSASRLAPFRLSWCFSRWPPPKQ